MAKELKTQYQEFVRNTAPDMDMLWSRIESEIDKRENVTGNETTYDENRKKIKTNGSNFKSITAAAAALIVIVSAAVFLNMRSNVYTDNAAGNLTKGENNEIADLTQDAADNGAAMDFTNGKQDEYFVTADNGAEAAQEGHKADKADEADFEEAEIDAIEGEAIVPEYNGEDKDDVTDKDSIKTNDGHFTAQDENVDLSPKSIEYSSLSLAETDTPPFMESYVSYSEDNAGEIDAEDIFSQTQYFADVTVENVQFGEDSAYYSLKVGALYSKDSDEIETQNITLNGASPYILRKNREYLLALKNVDGEWEFVCEDIPMIEITLDRELVYHRSWGQLSADEMICQSDVYPNMMYADSGAFEKLLEMWRKS